jgi:CDGSH-type Zn-finger protein/uncharacterized Fe-S cluster protein YjdI
MGRIREYEGEGIVVRYDARRCIHAGECVHGLPDVFDAERRPWVDADASSAEQIAAVVCRCPTGALSYERTDGGPAEPVLPHNQVRVEANGPLYASGDIELTMPDGTVRRETRVALCRCGDSKNKPYCDNTHLEAGFTAPAALGESKLREEEGEDTKSSLRLSLSPSGSIRMLGPVTLVAGDSKPQSGSRGFLCRCGGSENKPYCDGAHKRNDFEAE